jgi:osmotically-inducible protein OsmY
MIFKNISLIIFFVFASLSICNAQDNLIDDQDISQTIINKLQNAQEIDVSKMEVITNQGIVRIKGIANNLLAVMHAEDIASAVTGVRGVVNLLEVKQKLVSDEKIAERIKNRLKQKYAPTIENLRVKVAGGKVQISGVAHSWQEANLAGKVTAGIYGVTSLDNNISFVSKNNRVDEKIAAEIEKFLLMNARIDGDLIEVAVKDGEVKLSGTVGSAWEKNYAQKIAWVSGVENVKSANLNVEKWARDEAFREEKYSSISMDKTRQAILDAFLYDPRVSSFNISVEVENGIANLSGEVENLEAKRAAEETAKNIVGIWQVKNQIDVTTSEQVPDSVISKSLEDAYQWDPYLNENLIDITVYDDTVYLDGAVDNYYEKRLAEDIAGTLAGVENVRNRLTVDDDYPIGYYGGWITDDNSAIPVESPKSDEEIKEDIQEQFIWSPFVNVDEVIVNVNNGQATLSGTVETYEEYRYAEKNAYEAGAVFVDNNLDVSIDIPEN